MKLQGKIAVVTGASKGIGAGIAKGLAAVVVNYVSSKSDAESVVTQIKAQAAKRLAFRRT